MFNSKKPSESIRYHIQPYPSEKVIEEKAELTDTKLIAQQIELHPAFILFANTIVVKNLETFQFEDTQLKDLMIANLKLTSRTNILTYFNDDQIPENNKKTQIINLFIVLNEIKKNNPGTDGLNIRLEILVDLLDEIKNQKIYDFLKDGLLKFILEGDIGLKETLQTKLTLPYESVTKENVQQTLEQEIALLKCQVGEYQVFSEHYLTIRGLQSRTIDKLESEIKEQNIKLAEQEAEITKLIERQQEIISDFVERINKKISSYIDEEKAKSSEVNEKQEKIVRLCQNIIEEITDIKENINTELHEVESSVAKIINSHKSKYAQLSDRHIETLHQLSSIQGEIINLSNEQRSVSQNSIQQIQQQNSQIISKLIEMLESLMYENQFLKTENERKRQMLLLLGPKPDQDNTVDTSLSKLSPLYSKALASIPPSDSKTRAVDERTSLSPDDTNLARILAWLPPSDSETPPLAGILAWLPPSDSKNPPLSKQDLIKDQDPPMEKPATSLRNQTATKASDAEKLLKL